MSTLYSRHPSGIWRWTCEECGATGIDDRGADALKAAQRHQEVCGG